MFCTMSRVAGSISIGPRGLSNLICLISSIVLSGLMSPFCFRSPHRSRAARQVAAPTKLEGLSWAAAAKFAANSFVQRGIVRGRVMECRHHADSRRVGRRQVRLVCDVARSDDLDRLIGTGFLNWRGKIEGVSPAAMKTNTASGFVLDALRSMANSPSSSWARAPNLRYCRRRPLNSRMNMAHLGVEARPEFVNESVDVLHSVFST